MIFHLQNIYPNDYSELSYNSRDITAIEQPMTVLHFPLTQYELFGRLKAKQKLKITEVNASAQVNCACEWTDFS